MSGKLDKSLDEILSTQRRAVGGRRNPVHRAATGRKIAAPAPAGGIQKTSKVARNTVKPASLKSSGLTGESKIMVSNLPKDVSEPQIKEYFAQSIGQVKKVELSYGPNSASRGIAHVTFHHADGASKAFAKLNGLLIDNKPVKVEVVVANAALIPAPMSLGQRITQPKTHPKPAVTVKHAPNAKGGPVSKTSKKSSSRRAKISRVKKTAEELDSEMADYFDGANTTENANGAVANGTGGDAAMDDEVM